MGRRVLYVPIETKARELFGKTLLAARAVERGWQVVLGPQEVVREAAKAGPPGVFIEISIPDIKATKLAAYKRRGHRTANLCEESIVYYDALDYCRRKVGEESIAYTDIMLVVGESNAADLRRHRPAASGKIVVTGNPRFDTLAPGARAIYDAAAVPLRERYGRFLMVNTNFMRTNHFKQGPDEMIARLRSANLIVDDAHAEEVRRQYAYKGDQMEKLKPVLAAIADSRAFDTIVLRPHPSENHDTWREWAAPYGMRVVYEGTANEWMLASDAILHTGCTTGIESVLLDRPVASFQPIPGHYLLNQPDSVSEPFTTADEFLALAARWKAISESDRPAYLAGQRRRLVPLIVNVEPPRAVDRILDAFDELDVSEAPVPAVGGRSANPVQALTRFVRSVKLGRGGYHRQKFPGLTADDLAGPVATWIENGVLSVMPDMRPMPDGTWLLR